MARSRMQKELLQVSKKRASNFQKKKKKQAKDLNGQFAKAGV